MTDAGDVHLPAGLGTAAGTPACRLCPSGFYKDAAGPGVCVRCPPATIAVGDRAEDHDSAQDCYPISCPAGRERDTVAGGCKVCADNHFKAAAGAEPCTRCPPGSATVGSLAADHDDATDCLSVSCRAGQQPDPATGACVTCPADTFKTSSSPAACTACPNGTRTLGQLPADHDDASDCLAGECRVAGHDSAVCMCCKPLAAGFLSVLLIIASRSRPWMQHAALACAALQVACCRRAT